MSSRQQPGGASATLRKLVKEAKSKNVDSVEARKRQDATYQFIRVMAGDLPHYEDVLRALYAKDSKNFKALSAKWPKDIKAHTYKLAQGVF